MVFQIWVDELAGLPQNPSYQLDMKATTTDKLTFVERLYNTYIWLSTVLVSYYYAAIKMQALADEYVRLVQVYFKTIFFFFF